MVRYPAGCEGLFTPFLNEGGLRGTGLLPRAPRPAIIDLAEDFSDVTCVFSHGSEKI